jgi:hypothetical protein
LVLALGNGIILEMRAEADSHEALDVLRGLVRGTGNCQPVVLDGAQRERLWLYAEGDECCQQHDAEIRRASPWLDEDNFAWANYWSHYYAWHDGLLHKA